MIFYESTHFRLHVLHLLFQAMAIVRRRRMDFEAQPKASETRPDDVVTDVDKAVQTFIAGQLQTQYPGVAIVGEESPGDSIETDGPYWTVDPIDGTRAFVDHAPHGFSVMLSLVRGNEVLAAYIGDVMTGAVYWYAHGESPICMTPNPNEGSHRVQYRAPTKPRILFGAEPNKLPGTFSDLFGRDRPFDSYLIDSGSIGLRFMRLAVGNVAGIVLRPRRLWTPWDDNPTTGFGRLLGLRYLEFRPNGKFVEIKPPVVRKPVEAEFPALVVHESKLPSLAEWIQP